MPDDDLTRLPIEDSKVSLLSAGQSFGQYRVVRLLGRGGMGEVYEVENPVLEKRYALKLLNKEIMQRPEAAERFKREAKVMARFDHPNIVKVDDFGEIEGHAVLRMELVGDESAAQRPEDRGQRAEYHSLSDLLTGEPLPEALVVDLLKQILEGLVYAHEQGVVHRDLKPSNILLDINYRAHGGKETDSEGSNEKSPCLPDLHGKNLIPKISDFGLVRLAGEQWIQSQVQLTVARSMAQPADPDATRLVDHASGSTGTSTQALLGTFEFMSPEQRKGQEATAQSDLYSVGLMAFRMLTGQEQPGLDLPSEMVDGLDPAWDRWIKQAIAPDLKRRWDATSTMLAALPAEAAGSQPRSDLSSAEVDPDEALSTAALNNQESQSTFVSRNAISKESGRKMIYVGVIVLIISGAAVLWLFWPGDQKKGKTEPVKLDVSDHLKDVAAQPVPNNVTTSEGDAGDSFRGTQESMDVRKKEKDSDFSDRWTQIDDLVLLNIPLVGKEYRRVIPLSANDENFTYLAMNGRVLKTSLGQIPDAVLAEINAWASRRESVDVAYAQTVLGFAYTGLYGFEEDEALARQCFGAAAEKGHAGASFVLGEMLVYGQGGATDYSKAMELFRYASNEELPDAFTMIGFLYAEGLGVKADQNTANEYYRKGYDKGDYEAAWRLGVSYFYGLGVNIDRERGLGLIKEAVESGSERAVEILKIIKREHGVSFDEPEIPVKTNEGPQIKKKISFEERSALPVQTLTDAQGRTIRVKIIKVTKSEVKIRRSDGLETAIPLNMLSEDDVEFCRYLYEHQ